MKAFIYNGDNRLFVGKLFIFDKNAFYDENHNKLSTFDELEVGRYYYDFIESENTAESEGTKESNANIIKNDTIKAGIDFKYGNKASSIYLKMCDRFKWKTSCADQFGYKKPLYALNATPEGYSVQFLAHSNWTGSEGGLWKNVILEDKYDEYWPAFLFNNYTQLKEETRVTFAKVDNQYVFIGVFQTDGWQEEFDLVNLRKVVKKTYKLISKYYPM